MNPSTASRDGAGDVTPKRVIVNFTAIDRPGLVFGVTEIIARQAINIIDIDQSVVHGTFSIVLLCDLSTGKGGEKECLGVITKELEAFKGECNGYLFIGPDPTEGLDRGKAGSLAKVTVIGRDSPGIVAGVSGICSSHDVNIEGISMISRRDVFAMELLVRAPHDLTNFGQFKERLKDNLDKDGLSIIVQDTMAPGQEKKLVVFDMDSTLIRQECIDLVASGLDIESEVKKITDSAMDGNLDFTLALKARVALLKGVHIEFLESIAKNITLTPGARELVESLKRMGWKVALISGGFTFFTNKVKDELGLDYAFGNELVVEEGILTGSVNENFIIDAERKAKIQKWLAQIEGVKPENIITIGDGANDAIMIRDSGLGIGFKPRQMLKGVADGIINQDNLLGILFALGDVRKMRETTMDLPD